MLRIALIDDSAETRSYICSHWNELQLLWVSAPPFLDSKVEAAIIALQPDWIILDLSLDEELESGFRVLRRLKCSSELRSIPVVVLSKFIAGGEKDDPYKRKALGLGAAFALSKIPFPDLSFLQATPSP